MEHKDLLELLEESPDAYFRNDAIEVCQQEDWKDWYKFLLDSKMSLADLAFRLRDEVCTLGQNFYMNAQRMVCNYREKSSAFWDVWSRPSDWIVAALIARRLSERKK